MEKNVYETEDLPLSAFLMARGCRFDGAFGSPRITFRLEADEDIPALVTEFYNDGQVKVQTFLQNQKTLRTLVKNALGRRG
jgi:hypothetical protein